MNHDIPVPARSLADGQRLVLTAPQLREHGVTAPAAAERCRPGGPWQQILPGVFLLHPGPPTSEERLHSALLYAGRPAAGERHARSVPEQARAEARPGRIPPGRLRAMTRPGRPRGDAEDYGPAVITGLAALALHRFVSAPSLLALDRIDVLVPRVHRLRSAGHVRVLRTRSAPHPVEITGLPVAPVPRALADAVAGLPDTLPGAASVRRLLTEAVRGGHCEARAVVEELARARLLSRPRVTEAVDALLAEDRARAEGQLYALVSGHRLPEPLWNVELRLPGGPVVGVADAYWPEEAVALEIDTRSSRADGEAGADGVRETATPEALRRRERLERLGIAVVRTTPRRLRESAARQAAVVRTALMSSADREPAAYVVVLPR